MKKFLKIILIVFMISASLIILDTLQARLFKNSPILSFESKINDGYVKKGILMDTYYCLKEQDIVSISYQFKTSKYACPVSTDTKKSLDDLYKLELTKNKDIRNIDENYNLEQAQKDNCLVIKYNSEIKIANENVSNEFINNYYNKKDAFMRIASNTIEGNIILTDLIYVAKIDKIYLVIDSTRDVYSNKSLVMQEYTKLKENETNWTLYNEDNSYTIKYIFKNLNCLKKQIGAYVTSEKIIPEEISLKDLTKNNIDNIGYSYVLKNSLNHIALIINSVDKEAISLVEQSLKKSYKNIIKTELKDNYYIFIDNGQNDFDLENDFEKCLK